MSRPSIDIGVKGLKPLVYTYEAQAYFNALATQPSDAHKALMDTYLFKPLVENGIFAELERLWIGATELESNSYISLVNPTSTAMAPINSPTFTTLEGWTGDGSTSYIETNSFFDPTDGKYQQDDASFFIYLRTNSSGVIFDFGTFDGNPRQSLIAPRTTTDSILAMVNASTPVSGTNTDARGLYLIQRKATSLAAYKNRTTTLGSISAASVGLSTKELYLLSYNNNGSPLGFSDRQMSIAGYGSSNIDQATLSDILNGYMTQLGKNVY